MNRLDPLRVLILAGCLAWVGCGDDDDEPSVDEAPSAEPAPAPAPSPPPGAVPGHPPMPGSPVPSGPSAAAPTGPAQAGGLTWDAPAPLRRMPPTSQMRAAEYVFPEKNAGESPATLTVHHFPGMGGGVDANIDRWVGQFTQPDGSSSRDAAQISKKKVNGLSVTEMSVSGTFNGGMAMGPHAAKAPSKANQRMLGAVVEGPQGPIFFKMVGDRAVVDRAQDAFRTLVQSVRPL